MKIKRGFAMRTVCGEHVVVAEGIENIDFSKVIHLNETAAYLWEKLGDKEFSVADMVSLLTEEYDVTAEVAQKDCEDLANKWISAGIVGK